MYGEELDQSMPLQISSIDSFRSSRAEVATDPTERNLGFETDDELSPCTTMSLNRCIISARLKLFLPESIYKYYRSGLVFSRLKNE